VATSDLGQLLVNEGLLTESDRILIRTASGTQGAAFARGVIAIGLLDEEELAAFLAEKTKWRVADKDLSRESRKDAWAAIDRLLVERLEVMPLRLEGDTLLVAMVDPLDRDTIEQLRFFTGCRIKPVIATLSQIRTGLAKLLSDFKPASSHLENFLENHALSASQKIRLKQLGRGSGASLVPKPQGAEGISKPSTMPQAKDFQPTDLHVHHGAKIDKVAGRSADSGSRANSDNRGPEESRDALDVNQHQSIGSNSAPKTSTAASQADGDVLDDFGLDGNFEGDSSQGGEFGVGDDAEASLGPDLDSDLDMDLGNDAPERLAEQTKATQRKKASDDLTDDLFTNADDATLIFDADEQETAPTPSAGNFGSTATLGKDSPSTREEADFGDDLLGGSDLGNGDDINAADLDFVDDIPDSSPLPDMEPDLDHQAVQEISNLDDPAGLVESGDDAVENAETSAASGGEKMLPSDDDLFDIGALASDFNSIEDSIGTEKTPSKTPNQPLTTGKSLVGKLEGEEPEQAPPIEVFEPAESEMENQVALEDAGDGITFENGDHQEFPSKTPTNMELDEILQDPLDELALGSEDTSPNIPSLNRFMMTMSLMTDPKSAMDRAVPVLIEAGLTRGIVIDLTQGQSQAILGWGISGEVIERDTHVLARFNAPEGQRWLETAPRELALVDAQALSGPMDHYAPWVAGGQRQILSLVAPTQDPGRQVAFVTGWEHKGAIDLSLQNMVADIFRKIALHL
jgi:hypothetical protein